MHRSIPPGASPRLALIAVLFSPLLLVAATPVAAARDAPAPWRAELLAVATLPADARDSLGDTFGSISALAIERFTAASDGAWSADLLLLPDRGYNQPEKNFYSDYAGRLQSARLDLAPPSSPSSPASPWRARIEPRAARLLHDEHGRTFTGLDPAQGSREASFAGRLVALPALPDGRACLDAESLALARDGTVYLSDEYGPYIYVFGPDLVLRGVIVPPPAFLPRRDGRLDFTSTKAPRSGRRNNQGIEGLALSPDGARLFALTQSALVQDCAKGDPASRRWARLLVYDVSGDALPAHPIAHHVLELPLHPAEAGGPPTRTAAQSEMLALSAERIVVLSRDNLGLGSDRASPPLFKALVSYDLSSGATNLAGTPAETEPEGRVARDGALLPGIVPLRGHVVLDLLDRTALAKVGLHLDPAGDPAGYLSEKWEALALAPAFTSGEFVLLIGNDNDFQTRSGRSGGHDYDAGLENPNRILVYRVRLP